MTPKAIRDAANGPWEGKPCMFCRGPTGIANESFLVAICGKCRKQVFEWQTENLFRPELQGTWTESDLPDDDP